MFEKTKRTGTEQIEKRRRMRRIELRDIKRCLPFMLLADFRNTITDAVGAREARSNREPNQQLTPPHSSPIPSPLPSVECPPNTRMFSQTSQSSSTTSVSSHPHYTSLCAHSYLSLLFLPGLGNNQSWIRRPGSSKMLFPLIVRTLVCLLSGRVLCGEVGLT